MNLTMSQNDNKPELEQQIIENLRRAYNKTVEEEVPDRFLDLLKLLKDQDKSGGRKDG